MAHVGGRPAPQPDELAVPVQGADLNAVSRRYERDGSISGWAAVIGEWRGQGLRVDSQQVGAPLKRDDPCWRVPPCAAPPGGWPRAGRDQNPRFDAGDLEDIGAAVAVTIFRPSDDQQVVVVAAADAAAVERRLRPQLGESLCVVPSRWSKSQFDGVRNTLGARWKDWQLYGTGRHHDENGQASVQAHPLRVTREMADWAAAFPTGLLELRPWLVPYR